MSKFEFVEGDAQTLQCTAVSNPAATTKFIKGNFLTEILTEKPIYIFRICYGIY